MAYGKIFKRSIIWLKRHCLQFDKININISNKSEPQGKEIEEDEKRHCQVYFLFCFIYRRQKSHFTCSRTNLFFIVLIPRIRMHNLFANKICLHNYISHSKEWHKISCSIIVASRYETFTFWTYYFYNVLISIMFISFKSEARVWCQFTAK